MYLPSYMSYKFPLQAAGFVTRGGLELIEKTDVKSAKLILVECSHEYSKSMNCLPRKFFNK